MNNSIIMGKLQALGIGTGIIERNRLLAKVESFPERKITLVVAPAGYGKTVFIKQFVDSMKLPLVWYQLDTFDNDPMQFLKYLSNGLNLAIPDIQVVSQEFGLEKSNSDKRYYDAMTQIISELEKKAGNGLVIVFDDFHLINDSEILKFMENFLYYLPSEVHVIISCRYQDNLQLSRLKAMERIIEINQKDLEFSQEETIELLCSEKEAYPDEKFIELIHSALNGWALGLHLLKLVWGESYGSSDHGAALFRAKNEIFDYMSRELFARLPEDIQEFLLYTSVLDNMTPDVCNYMLDIQDAADKLKYIERKNLFIIAAGTDENTTYRYHHLFKEFLSGLLSDRKSDAYYKAGKYFLEHEAFEQSVEYFLLAGDNNLLIKAIERGGPQLLQQGRLKTVEGWLSFLVERNLLNSPSLIMLKGELLSYSGSFTEADELIDKASVLFAEGGDHEGQVKAAIHKARIIRYTVSFAESARYIDRFIKDVGKLPAEYYFEIAVEQVYSQWLMGDLAGAVRTAESCLRFKTGNTNSKAEERLSGYMAVIYYLQGRYSDALEHYDRLMESIHGNIDSIEQRSIPMYIAFIHRERGSLDLAIKMLKDSAVRKERLGLIEDLHLVYFNIAVTMLGYGEPQQIDHYCQFALDAFYKTGGHLDYYETLLKAFRCSVASYLAGEASQEAEYLMAQTIFNLSEKSLYLLVYISLYFVLYYLKFEKYDKAKELLELAIPKSESAGLDFQRSMLYGLKSTLLIKYGDKTGALDYTRQCLKLASAGQYRRFFIIFPEMYPCLQIAIENDLEQEFIEQIMLNLGPQAVPLLLELLKHPDPQVRERTVNLLKTYQPEQIQEEIELLFFDPDKNVREAGQQMFKVLLEKELETSAKLFVHCLGSFQVYLYNDWERPVSWRTSKARELFAYLLHHCGKPVSSERILANLWPDVDINKARDLLYTNISYIKKFLHQCGLNENLQKNQNGYSLDTTGIICDVWLPEYHHLKGSYLEDIYSDWPHEN